jgi:hypothetical protein
MVTQLMRNSFRSSITDGAASSAGRPISMLSHLAAQNAALREIASDLASHNARLRDALLQQSGGYD